MTGRRVVVAVTAVVLLASYASVLRGMFNQWTTDEDMGHGLAVPVVVAWIVWRERRRWITLPLAPTWWGFALLAVAACIHFLSAMGAGLFAGSVALLLSILGAVLAVGGFAFLRTWSFPLLLAVFMLPKLAVVYNQVTLPLQLTASAMAEMMLVIGGASVVREGNILNVAGHKIAVVEACSGVRYLLSLGFVSVVFAYLYDGKAWMRIALLAAAVPVAILANALRVAAIAWVLALDEGTLHELAGWLVFVLCMGMVVVVRRILNAAYARLYA